MPDEGRILIFPLNEVPGHWFYNVVLHFIVFTNGCKNFPRWVVLIYLEIAGINVFSFADLHQFVAKVILTDPGNDGWIFSKLRQVIGDVHWSTAGKFGMWQQVPKCFTKAYDG